jgi:hypothetical protein
MRKNPATRFSSAFDFARALQSVQQELSLSVTPIEIPDVEGGHSRPREHEGPADLDATRFKPARIDAQLPHAHANGAPSPRAKVAVKTHNGADGEWVEGTIARPTSSQLPAATKPPVVEPEPEPRSRKRLIALWSGVLAIAAVATIVVLLLMGAEGNDPEGVVTPSTKAEPQDVVPAAFVSPVEGAATRISPEKVRFTWQSPDPKPGDFFVVTRTDSGAGEQVNVRQKTLSYELASTASRPCLSVVLVRDGGQASSATVMCLES